ncbi:MFS transporter [Candidatus Bathyarchaeota archaeon]|nr:MFS transporter [Candidatus Bathyarchaeota archaeon]
MKDKKDRASFILKYSLIAMAFTHTLAHVLQRIHLALFPIIRTEFNLTLQQLGIIAAIPPLCQAILYIPMGIFTDRFGSRKMIIISLFVTTLGTLIASLTLDPLMLILAISLIYINVTMYHPASYSFTTRLFRIKDRPKALGIHGAGGTFGLAIGPISVSILMGVFAFRWRQIYSFWFLPLLLGLVAIVLIRPETTEYVREEKNSKGETKGNDSLFTRNLTIFLIFVAFRMMAWQMINAFLPIYLVDMKGLNEVLSSLIYGSNTLMGIVAAPIGGFLASKFGVKKWLMTAFSLAYISFGLALISPELLVFVTFYILYGFFNFLGMAANAAIMAKLAPSQRRGLGYSLFFLPGSIMGAVAPIIAAQIGEAFGLITIFKVAFAIYVVCLIILKGGVKF